MVFGIKVKNLPRSRTILFGVTSPTSIKLLGSLPSTFLKCGWNVHVVASRGPEMTRLARVGVNVHLLPMKREPSPLFDLFAVLRWWALLGKVRPDVVSVGTPKAAFVGLLAARLRRVPVRVYHLRGLRLEQTSGLARRLLWAVERQTAANATQVLAVSSSLRELFISLGLAPEEKILMVSRGSSHGVDTSRFRPQTVTAAPLGFEALERARAENRLIVAFVGRFCEDKGARALLACKLGLEAKGIDHEFVILGQVEGARAVLRQMNSSGRPALHFGAVEHLESVYPWFDLLLLPTKREGFPNVVLEASASGVAVVTTAATGAVDSVVDGVTGLVVPSHDPQDFFRATERLALNPGLRSKMGEAGRQRMVTYFDQEDFAAQAEALYTSLIGAHNKRKIA